LIEKYGVRNDLIDTIAAFIRITALMTKIIRLIVFSQPPAHPRIVFRIPDLPKRTLLQIPKNESLVKVIGAGAYRAVPMDGRSIP
jgi:hypothetical protein